MRRKALWACIIALALLTNIWLLGFMPLAWTGDRPRQAELSVASAQVVAGGSGKGVSLLVEGEGFDVDTRLSLVLDVGNKTAVRGRLETWSTLQDVEVRGRWAYLANSYRGLQIADIGDPERPHIVNSLPTAGKTWSLALDGDRLLVTDSRDGLLIYDVANPQQPVLLSAIAAVNRPLDVALRGRYAYVADFDHGLRVVDLGEGGRAAVIASLELDATAFKIAVAGDRAYLTSPAGGLHVVDISDPARPVLLGRFLPEIGIFAVAVSDRWLYLADRHRRFLVVDALDPAQVRIVGAIEMPSAAFGFEVEGQRAYIADGLGGFLVLALEDPAAPRIVGRICAGNDRGVTVAEGRAYLAGNRSGLKIVDLASAERPLQAIGALETDGFARALAFEGDTLFLADGTAGLKIVDLAEPQRPRGIAAVKTGNCVWEVKVRAGLAYLADGEGGLRILDVSLPDSPRLLGAAQVPGEAIQVAVAGERAYVIGSDASLTKSSEAPVRTLHVIDIGDPNNPRPVGRLALFSRINDVYVWGNKVLLAGLHDGLHVVDAADPRRLRLLGSATLPWPRQSFASAITVQVKEATAYLANGRAGLQVIDLEEEASPRIVASIGTSGYAKDVDLDGDRAFLVDYRRGLKIFDLSNRGRPQLIGSVPLPINAEALVVRDGRIHVANGQNGLLILPLPLEPDRLVVESPGRLRAHFPPATLAGDYLLQVSNGRDLRLLPDAISLAAQK